MPDGAFLNEADAVGVFAIAMPARHLSDVALTPAQRQAITLARRLARQSFRWFIAYVTADDVEPYQFDSFHLEIIEELQRVYDGGEKRLLLAAPPRHGKSKLCAILFPCFALGRRPQAKVIIAAYNQELAREHLREARAILLSQAFGEVFPGCALAEDGMAADLLRTKQEGSCRATGAGGILTGLGADLLVLDDLIKGYDEAQSELVRSSLWSWYATSARTRLSPSGAIVTIGTRWHHDDVLGRLVRASEDGTGEAWRHVAYPAINAKGEPLWPARFPLPSLLALKTTLGQTQWQALFQGSPSPAGGGFLRASWFPYFSPENFPQRDLLNVLCTDFALSEAAGDWSVIALLAIDPEGKIYLREMWRERVTMDRTVSALIGMLTRWRPAAWCYENDAIMQSALPLIRQRMVKAGVNVWHIQHSRQASKVQKAGPLQGILEERGIHVPVGAPWVDALLREAEEFPAGQHDDQVDALAHLGRAWLKLRPRAATLEGPPQRPRGGPLSLVMQDGRQHLPLGLEDLYEAGCGPRPVGKWSRI
jgi:predicted phage terminase large subunit-like protein